MPNYEYKCVPCDVVDEKVRTIADKDAPLSCKYCHGPMVALTYPTSFGISTPGSDNNPIDIKIGSAANKRWEELDSRKANRDRIRVENNQNGLSATPDGEKIIPISPEKKEVRTKVLDMIASGGNKYL